MPYLKDRKTSEGIFIPNQKGFTLDSGIDIEQEINIGPGKFVKKNKRRALNNHRVWKIWQKIEVFVKKKTTIFFLICYTKLNKRRAF